MRSERTHSILGLCALFLVLSLSLPQSGEALTWGFPTGSTLGQCLASRVMKFDIFPDRASALASMQADYAGARALCDAYPDPKPLWCSYLSYREWNCAYQQQPYCLVSCACGMLGCSGVTDCGFSCRNCRGHGAIQNGDYISTNYWYYVCSPTYSPPSQQQDVPITTEITDKNTGGPCEGTCNTIINDGGEDR